MRKITLALGSLVSIAAPVSAVVACGSSESTGSNATAQSEVNVGSSMSKQNIVDLGSTIAHFENGKYLHTPTAAAPGDVHAPNSIEAIAKANVASGIATTGHYSILINLLNNGELNNAEALKVHQAFVKAYNSIANHKKNDLDANVLKEALTALKLPTKLNLNIFQTK